MREGRGREIGSERGREGGREGERGGREGGRERGREEGGRESGLVSQEIKFLDLSHLWVFSMGFSLAGPSPRVLK